MEYLNHQKDFPMTASFTSDEEMFFKQEQEGDFECLVLAEETDYHGDFPVCRIGANESMGGMYCQSAKEIAAGIYHCLNVSPVSYTHLDVYKRQTEGIFFKWVLAHPKR